MAPRSREPRTSPGSVKSPMSPRSLLSVLVLASVAATVAEAGAQSAREPRVMTGVLTPSFDAQGPGLSLSGTF